MEPDKRIITQLPLERLWTADGEIRAEQVRDLRTTEIASLLRNGVVRFVVADLGGKLEWKLLTDCFQFWKSEVRERVVDPGEQIRCWEYPLGYCYSATEWSDAENTPIVLLEVYH